MVPTHGKWLKNKQGKERDQVVKVRLTLSEYKTLQMAAGTDGVAMAGMLRSGGLQEAMRRLRRAGCLPVTPPGAPSSAEP